jgi:hypothetical protein
VQGQRVQRKDLDKSKDKYDRPTKYAHLIERGHVDRGGGFVAPRPFIRTGAIAGAPAAEAILFATIDARLKKALSNVQSTGNF